MCSAVILKQSIPYSYLLFLLTLLSIYFTSPYPKIMQYVVIRIAYGYHLHQLWIIKNILYFPSLIFIYFCIYCLWFIHIYIYYIYIYFLRTFCPFFFFLHFFAERFYWWWILSDFVFLMKHFFITLSLSYSLLKDNFTGYKFWIFNEFLKHFFLSAFKDLTLFPYCMHCFWQKYC